jgi:CBS domain-containing protein
MRRLTSGAKGSRRLSYSMADIGAESGTSSADTPIGEVARLMRAQRVHRLLVIDQRELLGVLTTFDLLRAFD